MAEKREAEIMRKTTQKNEASGFGAKERVFDTCEKMDGREILVPYVVHEAEAMRMERHARRLWIALVVSVVCILLSNLVWLWYINQYDFADYDYEQDGEGVNIIGNRNEVGQYGAETQNENPDEEEEKLFAWYRD
jgi:hypothetical protein